MKYIKIEIKNSQRVYTKHKNSNIFSKIRFNLGGELRYVDTYTNSQTNIN